MIKELVDTCYDCNNWNEYKEAYEKLNVIVPHPVDTRINKISVRSDDTIRFVDTIKDHEPIRFEKGTVLLHYSNIELSELRSSFRSIDGVLYSSNRIYFWIDDSVNTDREYKYCYQYICDGTEMVYPDPEFDDCASRFNQLFAVYFSMDHEFTMKVKRIED